MCPAIHTSSRSWLRSSSTHEPSDPPLRIVLFYFLPCRRGPGEGATPSPTRAKRRRVVGRQRCRERAGRVRLALPLRNRETRVSPATDRAGLPAWRPPPYASGVLSPEGTPLVILSVNSARRPGTSRTLPLPRGTGRRRRTSRCVNDPSAGSPTETLLRLLLPLNDQV